MGSNNKPVEQSAGPVVRKDEGRAVLNIQSGLAIAAMRRKRHKKSLLKGRCPASGRTFAKGFKRVGRPYVLRYVRRSRTT